MHIEATSLEIFRHLFESLAEEMGITLRRAAFSPNIRERLDFSCALFDASGHLVSQAAHIPVHLGSMPELTMALARRPQRRGDVWLVNSPDQGGTHLPDLTVVAPHFDHAGELLAFSAARAHHSDVGGMSPGSMPMSREIFQEGLVLPPVRVVKAGRRCPDVWTILLANVRTPREREGDLLAQLSACRQGGQRLHELEQRHGAQRLRAAMKSLQDYSERRVREALVELGSGQAVQIEELEWHSPEGMRMIPLEVRLSLSDGRVCCDFSNCPDSLPAPINAARPVTCAASYYALLAFLGEEIPINQGAFRPLQVITRPGSVLDARLPAAVAAGNVETSQRAVDAVLGALRQLFPERVPATSGSTMNNLTVGGWDTRRERAFTYYETAGGGHGASREGPGLDAAQIHMTNTRNTPAETLEREYPLRLWRYAVRSGSGGEGQHRGGHGLVRELEFLADVEATLLTTRRFSTASGSRGGEPGQSGCDSVRLEGRWQRLAPQGNWRWPQGTRLCIETPGGGGWGPPDPSGPN